MKKLLFGAIALSTLASHALAFDAIYVPPTLTWPQPVAEPVTQACTVQVALPTTPVCPTS